MVCLGLVICVKKRSLTKGHDLCTVFSRSFLRLHQQPIKRDWSLLSLLSRRQSVDVWSRHRALFSINEHFSQKRSLFRVLKTPSL